ncbi:MAG: hypothetical protein DDT19_01058 [Syntrophomonadaceae bacterium]|nr:hypothetical protein [Bacillota bacterium]
MAMDDLFNNLSTATTLAPAARTAAATGTTVDLQGFAGALVQAVVGTITDGVHTLAVQESADNITWTAVAAADLQGSFVTLATGVNQRVGYRGIQRFIRVNAAASGVTGGVYAVVVVRGTPRRAPVA